MYVEVEQLTRRRDEHIISSGEANVGS